MRRRVFDKPCAKCKSAPSLSYNVYCRSCRQEYDRSYCKAVRFKHRKATQTRRQNLVRSLKDVPCKDCGIKYPYYVMDFDHISDKLFDIATSLYNVSVEVLLDEIAKCEVVCSNCHRERTHKRRVKIKGA